MRDRGESQPMLWEAAMPGSSLSHVLVSPSSPEKVRSSGALFVAAAVICKTPKAA